jgi:glycosyltransferase involved in cell wall biosynthesis
MNCEKNPSSSYRTRFLENPAEGLSKLNAPLRISVVIPLYNKRATIRRAIDSILAQETAGVEIIVVDDGSTDGSASEVESIADERITLIRQANAGPGRARNVGASYGRADLLAFLDGDDEWKPGFLAAGIGALSQNPQAVAYACSFDTGAFADRVEDKVSRLASAPIALPPPTTAVGPYRMKLALDGLHSSSTIVRRTAFLKAGGFYDRERCLWGEDSYLWSQVLFMGPVYWDPTPRIFFHVEDSELGFAKKHRDQARPLVTYGMDMVKDVAPEHRAAFWMLVQRTASRDAEMLMESGYARKSLQLRYKFRVMQPTALIGDAKRYLKYAYHRITAK